MNSFNNIYYPVLFLGIIAAGGVFTGSNPAYTHHELVHHITTARVKFLISEPGVLDHLRSAAVECKIPSENMWLLPSNPGQSSHSGLKSWRELLEYGERDWLRFNDLETCRNTPAARLFSSGTTGLPKATNMTHYDLIAQHELVYEGLNKRPYDVGIPQSPTKIEFLYLCMTGANFLYPSSITLVNQSLLILEENFLLTIF